MWHFAVDAGALLVLLVVAMFCAVSILALWENYIYRRIQFGSRFMQDLAQERENRKNQNREIRERMRRLEDAVRELNPGLNI